MEEFEAEEAHISLIGTRAVSADRLSRGKQGKDQAANYKRWRVKLIIRRVADCVRSP